MSMLFKAFLPKPLGASDVANVAVSTSIFVNNTRIEGGWEFIFKSKERGESV